MGLNRYCYQEAIPRKDAALSAACTIESSGGNGFIAFTTTTGYHRRAGRHRALAGADRRLGLDRDYVTSMRGRSRRRASPSRPT